jgi:hypothetical protein
MQKPEEQPEADQRLPGQADAEFLKRRSARDGLGHSFGQFIEFVVYNFPFIPVLLSNRGFLGLRG